MNAIFALCLRQLKRYIRSRARIIGSLGQPVLFLLALGFGLGPIFEKAGAGNYMQFLAPGVMAMAILYSAVFSGMEIIWDRQFGFLKETLIAPIPRLYIVIGRTLGGALVAVIQGSLVLAVCVAAGFRIENMALLPIAIGFMFFIAVFCTALGTAFASLMEDVQGFQIIMNFLVMPLFFFSNALFPTEGLSKPLHRIVEFNPLTYGIDGLRSALTHPAATGLATDFLVLFVLTGMILALGSYLFSRIQL